MKHRRFADIDSFRLDQVIRGPGADIQSNRAAGYVPCGFFLREKACQQSYFNVDQLLIFAGVAGDTTSGLPVTRSATSFLPGSGDLGREVARDG